MSKRLLTEEEVKKVRKHLLSSFKTFVSAVWDNAWYDENFHGPLCEFIDDKRSEDKVIILPRSHLKTTIATQLLSIFESCKNPNIRILIVQNSELNVKKTVRGIREILESNEVIQTFFSHLIPSNKKKYKWNDSELCLVRTGAFRESTIEGAGINSNVVSKHYDLIIEDDTCAPRKDEMRGAGGETDNMEIMPSRDEIEKAIGFHKLTMPLAVDMNTFRRLFVGTRWADYDIISYIQRVESSPTDEDGNEVRYYTTFSKPAVTENGAPSYKRMSVKALNSIRRNLGSYMYHMLYLNMPLSSKHMKFKPQDIRYFTLLESPDCPDLFLDLDTIDKDPLITIDPADPPTGSDSQCSSAIVVGLDCSLGLFVLDYDSGLYTDKEIIDKALALADAYDCFKIRVEVDRYPHLIAAFKIAIARHNAIRMSQRLPKKHYSLEPVKTRGKSKASRIMRLVPLSEGGLLYLKRSMKELEKEMFSFPHGRTNDILDALAWQVNARMTTPSYVSSEVTEKIPNGMSVSFETIMESVKRKQRKGLPCYAPCFTSSAGSSSFSGRYN